VRWSRMGVFDRIFAGLAADAGVPEQTGRTEDHAEITEEPGRASDTNRDG